MNGLYQVYMRAILNIWINPVGVYSQFRFTVNKVKFSNDFMIRMQKLGMNGKPGSQIAQDVVYFTAFSMFQRKNFIVEADGFFGFDKRSFAAVTFAVQNSFHLSFVFGK